MSANAIIGEAESKMKKALNAVLQEFSSLRTGRAVPALLDRVEVEFYGSMSPIKQMASVSVPDSRTLAIQPYDRNTLGAIEKAILKSDLGLTPTSDGSTLRILFPPPTEERRKELAKLAKKEAEEGKVALRNVRRDENDKLKALEKKNELTQDESKRLQDQLQKLTDRYVQEIEQALSKKEAEIMEV